MEPRPMVLEKPKVTAGLVFESVWGRTVPQSGLSPPLSATTVDHRYIVRPHSGDLDGTKGLLGGVGNPGHVQHHISAAQFHLLKSGIFPLHRELWLGTARVALGLCVAMVMGVGGCCWVELSLACIEKQRLEEAEDPTG